MRLVSHVQVCKYKGIYIHNDVSIVKSSTAQVCLRATKLWILHPLPYGIQQICLIRSCWFAYVSHDHPNYRSFSCPIYQLYLPISLSIIQSTKLKGEHINKKTPSFWQVHAIYLLRLEKNERNSMGNRISILNLACHFLNVDLLKM